MNTRRVRFLLVPLLMMSLLAVSCTTGTDMPTGLRPGGWQLPEPGVLPGLPIHPIRPDPGIRPFLNRITITSPLGGQIWYTGYTAPITWTCYTHAIASDPVIADPFCRADAGVWRGGNPFQPLGAGVVGGNINWSIPFFDPAGVELAGAFEIRVDNVFSQFGNPALTPTPVPGLEGRQTFTIVPSTATVDAPTGTLISGDPNGFVSAVTWSYTGYPPPLNLQVFRTSTATTTYTGVTTAGGVGGSHTETRSWTVNDPQDFAPPPIVQPELFRFQLIDAGGKVWSTSNDFLIYPYRDCSAPGGFFIEDTACKYNPAAAAIFRANTPIKLVNGYVTEGTLAVVPPPRGPDQDVFYANGKSVKLKGDTGSGEGLVYFANGYLQSGRQLAGDHVLYWAPNQPPATWKDGTHIGFSDGWVTAGTLRNPTPLPHVGSPCCFSYPSICTINYPNDREILCSFISAYCFNGLSTDYCTACVSPGVNSGGDCCCN